MTIGLCSNSRQISSVIDSCASSEIGESKNGGFQTPNRNKTSLFKRPGRLPVSGTSQIIIVIPPTQPYLQRKSDILQAVIVFSAHNFYLKSEKAIDKVT